MSNDFAVNFGDINPFVAALSDPNKYALSWPGLAGGILRHGDCNCDGRFNVGDISPFIALLNHPCSICSFGEGNVMAYGGEDDSGPMTPEELAAGLAANIWPELYDDLLNIVGEEISSEEDDVIRDYWETVYDTLTE
jgi:hypothetical protein